MIARRASEPRLLVIVTALVALVLQVIPLPYWLAMARPALLVLVVLYWSVAAPRAGGIAIGFIAGLALDVFSGSVLGQHALAVALVSYLAIRFHLQIRNHSIFQQALFAFAALSLYEFVVWAIDGWSGQPIAGHRRWLHPLAGALCWPLVVIALDGRRTASR